MRYVVTGAAGFIGSHLVARLRSAGHDVVGLDCFTDYYDPALKEDNARTLAVAGRRGSARRRRASLDFAGADGVFHLAGQPGVRSFGDVFELYVRRNLLATQRVFEAAVRDGVKVVFASSSSIYGAAERYPTPEETPPSPLSPYGITKLALRAPGRGVRARVRPRLRRAALLQRVFGPRQRPDMAFTRIAFALATGGTFELYGDGAQSRGWTYVADVVEGTIAAMERGRGTYNVGGALEASMSETIALFEEIAGRPLDLRRARRGPGRPAAHERGHDPDPRGARLAAADLAARRPRSPVGVGARRSPGGPCRVESPPR